MPESLHATVDHIQERNGGYSPCFLPPAPCERLADVAVDGDGQPTGELTAALPHWLWRLTIPGAPIVPVLHVPHAPGPGCVPFLRLRVPLGARPAAWPPGQRDAQILELVPAGQHRWPRGDRPRAHAGRPRWEAEAAYFHDLAGEPKHEVARRLDLGDDEAHREDNRARAAHNWIARGRQRLAAIGAWPWALVPAGKLPRDWWRDVRYAEALAAWHREAFVAHYCDALRAVQYAAGDRSDTRWAPGNREAALQLYAAQFP